MSGTHSRKNSGWNNRSGFNKSIHAYNRSLPLLGNNDDEAFRLTEIAALEGMHDAVLAMGWFYLNGVGVEADEDEAIRWYRKSARQGDPRAMFSLGQIAYWKKDFSDALSWFTRAFQKQHHRSLYWIGKMHWRGEGVTQDRKLARRLLAQAASARVTEAQLYVSWISALTTDRVKAEIRKRAISIDKY